MYESDQATNQVCQKVGVGRRRRCAGHPWEEHHHLDFEMDLISQDFPNRKGAVGVGNVNVQVVVKLAKDLSAGFQFGAMMSLMIIIMMTMMSFPIISQVSQLSHA